ncbi:UNVERIFIED_CONTAM: hypothetical protein GTU68_049550 [Idotea baltica]|nr:hypothetical protein [Idotea baltica]
MKYIETLLKEQLKTDLPDFRTGDTVKVYNKIVEGAKERVQIFEGVVILRSKKNKPNATFTVRKVSYNVGVERTFLLHSPRIEKIEIVSKGIVRRARLFYLRDLRGKKARIKSKLEFGNSKKKTETKKTTTENTSTEVQASM